MTMRLASLPYLNLFVAMSLGSNATTRPSMTALSRTYAATIGPITVLSPLYVPLPCSAPRCPAVALRSIAMLHPAAVI